MSSNDLTWVDELFNDESDKPSPAQADRLLDYCLHLISSSTLGHTAESLENDLIDSFLQMSRAEWDETIVMLKLNQLRVVDLYSCSQRRLSTWIRQIAIDEYTEDDKLQH